MRSHFIGNEAVGVTYFSIFYIIKLFVEALTFFREVNFNKFTDRQILKL